MRAHSLRFGTLGGMTPREIVDFEGLEAIFTAPRFLIFKHSNRCGTSTRAFRQYEQFLAQRPDFPTAWIDVVTQPAWSEHVANETLVPHESPQALLLRDGEVAWHASHWDITLKALEEATGA